MTSHILALPAVFEHAPYISNYIRHVHSGTIEEILASDREATASLFAILKPGQGEFTYAPGKWTVKQVLIHCMDTERIFACRALMIARGDQGKLPGYDHEAYAAITQDDKRSLNQLQVEWAILRQSNVALFQSFDASDMIKIGNANGYPFSPRAAVFIIPGHTLHHLEVLREKYGLKF